MGCPSSMGAYLVASHKDLMLLYSLIDDKNIKQLPIQSVKTMIKGVINSEKMQFPATNCTRSINRLLTKKTNKKKHILINEKDKYDQTQDYSSMNKDCTPDG